MPEPEVVLRGVLDSLSGRFYTGGWGYGTLSTEQGQIKITGTLEGHVTGTSLVVRGAFRETQYGRQLSCTSIVVDAVTGNLEVIRAWLKRYCPDVDAAEVARVCAKVPVDDRWDLLVDATALEGMGLDRDVAQDVALYASDYLAFIALKRELLERGFHDLEADRLIKAYDTGVNKVLDEDPFRVVVEQHVIFTRIDTVCGQGVSRNHERRIQAAMVQALVNAQKNGHTAQPLSAMVKAAADMADVYPEQIKRAAMPDAIVCFDQLYQLRTTARLEHEIAQWVVEAMRRS